VVLVGVPRGRERQPRSERGGGFRKDRVFQKKVAWCSQKFPNRTFPAVISFGGEGGQGRGTIKASVFFSTWVRIKDQG